MPSFAYFPPLSGNIFFRSNGEIYLTRQYSYSYLLSLFHLIRMRSLDNQKGEPLL